MPNSRRRRQDIRAYAAEHQISYTAAMRALDSNEAHPSGLPREVIDQAREMMPTTPAEFNKRLTAFLASDKMADATEAMIAGERERQAQWLVHRLSSTRERGLTHAAGVWRPKYLAHLLVTGPPAHTRRQAASLTYQAGVEWNLIEVGGSGQSAAAQEDAAARVKTALREGDVDHPTLVIVTSVQDLTEGSEETVEDVARMGRGLGVHLLICAETVAELSPVLQPNLIARLAYDEGTWHYFESPCRCPHHTNTATSPAHPTTDEGTARLVNNRTREHGRDPK